MSALRRSQCSVVGASGCAPTTTASRHRSIVAIRDLVVRGRINATSVMVVAPSFQRPEAAALDSLNTGEPAWRSDCT